MGVECCGRGYKGSITCSESMDFWSYSKRNKEVSEQNSKFGRDSSKVKEMKQLHIKLEDLQEVEKGY